MREDRQTVLDHADKLEQEAARLDQMAAELRKRAAWLCAGEDRTAEDWEMLRDLVKLGAKHEDNR